MVPLQQMIYVFFKERKEKENKWWNIFLKDILKHFMQCVTCTKNRMYTPTWTTVLLGLHAILLADFHIVWERNRRKWEDVLDRGLWHQSEQAQTPCWSEIGAQYFFRDSHREFQIQNCGMESWAGQMETCLHSTVHGETSLSCSVFTLSHSWQLQPHPGKRGGEEVQRGASRQVDYGVWLYCA